MTDDVFTDSTLAEVIDELNTIRTLTKSAGWDYLLKFLEGEIAKADMTLLAPLHSLDQCPGQEFIKGMRSLAVLIPKHFAVREETLQEQLDIIKEREDVGTETRSADAS